MFVTDLFKDLGDGTIMLQVLDQIFKGSVNWKAAIKNPGTIYKRLENCNLAVETARTVCASIFEHRECSWWQAGLKLKGVSGENVANGDQIYVLAFIWQLWRAHLADLLLQAGGSDKKPDEKTILKWMNDLVCSMGQPG